MVRLISIIAAIQLGTPFSDNMVLQREMEVPIWGRATAGNKVVVNFGGRNFETKVGADGKWMVTLPSLKATKKNQVMTVTEQEDKLMSGEVDRVEIKNVLVGEVWFASGQSNMECPIWARSTRYRDGKGGLMTAMTNLENIRFAAPANVWSVEPREYKERWRKFVPKELNQGKSVSAVAFYYARELYLALDVPIGIVSVNWGGSNIDAWTPRSGYVDCDKSIQDTADYKIKDEKSWKKERDRVGPITSPHQQPTALWNGMVAAWAPYANRGFIWYQGCSNSEPTEAKRYCAKMHALYNGWSREFKNPDLKLYFVQLAPWMTSWPTIVPQQNQFAAEEKNAELAVASDVGNFQDIHPNDKETVAQRLVVHALKNDYGFDIPEANSPVVKSVEYKGNKAIVKFDHAKELYIYTQDRTHEAPFELAGEDGEWKPAKIVNWQPGKTWEARDGFGFYVEGSTVELQSDAVKKPMKVRYMGQNSTTGVIYNEVSLPLGYFEK